ncbi:hypothetical protein Hanom_Chr17g01587071 [Helianthus anomalus]
MFTWSRNNNEGMKKILMVNMLDGLLRYQFMTGGDSHQRKRKSDEELLLRLLQSEAECLQEESAKKEA